MTCTQDKNDTTLLGRFPRVAYIEDFIVQVSHSSSHVSQPCCLIITSNTIGNTIGNQVEQHCCRRCFRVHRFSRASMHQRFGRDPYFESLVCAIHGFSRQSMDLADNPWIVAQSTDPYFGQRIPWIVPIHSLRTSYTHS